MKKSYRKTKQMTVEDKAFIFELFSKKKKRMCININITDKFSATD